MRSYRGVTLIELLVVLLILVLVLAISARYFISFVKKQKLKSQVVEFVQDVQYAETLAFKRGGARLEIKDNSYKILSTNGTIYVNKSVPKWINFSCSENSVDFQPNTLPATGFNCVFSAGSGLKFTVKVDNISGRVIWEK